MKLNSWIRSRRKILAKVPKGIWYQDVRHVNVDLPDTIVEVGDGRIWFNKVSVCCDADTAAWIRESAVEMERALRIIEEVDSWAVDYKTDDPKNGGHNICAILKLKEEEILASNHDQQDGPGNKPNKPKVPRPSNRTVGKSRGAPKKNKRP